VDTLWVAAALSTGDLEMLVRWTIAVPRSCSIHIWRRLKKATSINAIEALAPCYPRVHGAYYYY